MRRRTMIGGAVLLTAGLAGCGRRRGAPEARGEIRYVALGASDAVGIGALPLTNGYVYRISEGLRADFAEMHFLNTGYPGGRARDIRRIAETALPRTSAPDLITLWTGGNDIIGGDHPQDFEEELARILETAAGTGALVVVGNLPDMRMLPRFRAEPSPSVTLDRIEAFNAAIERQAAARGALVVDLFAERVEDELTSDIDGFHPSNDGHRHLAELFLAVIRPALSAAVG